MSLLADRDLYLFNEGTHLRLYNHLGCHLARHGNVDGAWFGVWAPNAAAVSVIGTFNGWTAGAHRLLPRGDSGIWEAFVPGIQRGDSYKFHVESKFNGYKADKADPFAIHAETSPHTASKAWDLAFAWSDGDWMSTRAKRNGLRAPMSIYEMHVGSWRRFHGEGKFHSYRELAEPLCEYLEETGFTHVEFLPLTEHPFYGSWGYQCTGYFAATSRYGTPQDLMYLIDCLHRRQIGVILDWVPSHFPTDEWALGYFDGTHLFEHSDPRKGLHKDWDSLIFNLSRHEVRSFLLSSAAFWLDHYHIDALRVDAVASMLYLDYSRNAGEWIPNEFGGHENTESVAFLRQFNTMVYAHYPDTQTIAEESTSWPAVSHPVDAGGLGFGLKWDMGWMNDTLSYLSLDPVYRAHRHSQITFRSLYAFHENFVMALSHDEVVHGKRSLLGRMPGDLWQKFANLRLLMAYLYTQPGKKLLFMGAEFGQWREWNHDGSLDWNLLEIESHRQAQHWVSDLNRAYRKEPSLHELDCEARGFEWIDGSDAAHSILAYLRKSTSGELMLCVFNFTPVPRTGYRVGVPIPGTWTEYLNSDSALYGGSGMGNMGAVVADPLPMHGRDQSLNLTIPPLAVVLLKSPATGQLRD